MGMRPGGVRSESSDERIELTSGERGMGRTGLGRSWLFKWCTYSNCCWGVGSGRLRGLPHSAETWLIVAGWSVVMLAWPGVVDPCPGCCSLHPLPTLSILDPATRTSPFHILAQQTRPSRPIIRFTAESTSFGKQTTLE